MTILRQSLLTAILAIATTGTMAQSNGSNSSYSRFGLGTLTDRSQGFNKSMGGVAQGLRSGNRVNMLNPASYSAVDSLTFIFDMGMGLQFGNLKQAGNSINVRNTTLNHINAVARLSRGLGISFGFAPYSNIGYNFSREGRVGTDNASGQPVISRNTYYGNGGTHEMYVGVGWNPLHRLSIGANIAYLWGDYNHSMAQQFYEGTTSTNAYSSLSAEYSGNIRTWKADIGIQYPIRMGKADWLTLGATVGIGHNTKDDASMNRYTSAGDTLSVEAKDAFQLPYTYSAGLAWQHKGRLTLAADYTREQWADCVLPVTFYNERNELTMEARKGQYLNRNKVCFGAEFIPNPLGRNYGDHIEYRLGCSYSTPYVKIAGADGPREYGITAGLGLPISPKTISGSRSRINIGLQWMHRAPSATSMVTENYYMLNIGFTFNEQWFSKWKFN